jgi:hypothetical protein
VINMGFLSVIRRWALHNKMPIREMRWLPPSLDGIAMCQDGGVESH